MVTELSEKYNLTKAEELKLMEDNEESIKKLAEDEIEISDEVSPEAQRADGELNLDGKKYTIITRFETSNAVGPIAIGQSFTIKLDDRLTVKDTSTLKSIYYKGKEIARPSYDSNTNAIKYMVTTPISDSISIPLRVDVDYNVQKVKELDGNASKHSIKNSISGVGVVNRKSTRNCCR